MTDRNRHRVSLAEIIVIALLSILGAKALQIWTPSFLEKDAPSVSGPAAEPETTPVPGEEEISRCRQILEYYDPAKLESVTGAYHSWAAKYYLRENCCFHDSDILNAIYNHTICNSRDKLSLILYIADKREPSRKIDDDITEIAKKDLYQAYKKLNLSVERYIREVKNERFVEDRI